MLHVQEYLKTHSLAQLQAEYKINSSWKSPTYKVSLNYDQIESQAGPVTNQCRGLILAKHDGSNIDSIDKVVGETIVLARPMDRFFNYGDVNAAKVDFESASTCYFEKLDGTLCIVYHDPFKKEWCVATRSVPEANLPIDGFADMTFRKLFEKAVQETSTFSWKYFVECLDTHHDYCTYCFELTSPYNRVVVDYKETVATFLAIRNNHDGHEELLTQSDADYWEDQFNLPVVKRYTIRTVQDLMEFVNSRNPTEHEGVVVFDPRAVSRVKVKNAAYLAYNRARDIVAKSPRALLELILLERIDDVLPLLADHMKERTEEMRISLINLMHKIDANYAVCKKAADVDLVNPRKAFCLEAQANQFWLEPLINRYLGKCDNAKSFIQYNKLVDGSFENSFLDKLITQMKLV